MAIKYTGMIVIVEELIHFTDPIYNLVLILPLPRNYVPNPAGRIFHIAGVSGNDVYVDMENCLTGSGSWIETDVEAIRLEVFFQEAFGLLHQLPDIVFLYFA